MGQPELLQASYSSCYILAGAQWGHGCLYWSKFPGGNAAINIDLDATRRHRNRERLNCHIFLSQDGVTNVTP